MTYNQFLMVAIGFMVLLFVFMICKIIRDQPTAPLPRRLKSKSSSGVGTDVVMPMADSDSGGDGGD